MAPILASFRALAKPLAFYEGFSYIFLYGQRCVSSEFCQRIYRS